MNRGDPLGETVRESGGREREKERERKREREREREVGGIVVTSDQPLESST